MMVIARLTACRVSLEAVGEHHYVDAADEQASGDSGSVEQKVVSNKFQ